MNLYLLLRAKNALAAKACFSPARPRFRQTQVRSTPLPVPFAVLHAAKCKPGHPASACARNTAVALLRRAAPLPHARSRYSPEPGPGLRGATPFADELSPPGQDLLPGFSVERRAAIESGDCPREHAPG